MLAQSLVLLATLICSVYCILPMPVSTLNGPVLGVVAGNVTYFKGIPYAAPPLGALRWKAPAPPASWSKPLNATRYSKICSQPVWDFLPPQLASLQSEDCLYLNIWVPTSATPSSKLPVMVWFHPGGNYKGSSLGFAGTNLSPYGNVIVVSLNYRLGVMGFLVTEGALLENPAVNYGLQDQQAALRWVRDNIANFGGDPTRVTIAGESAGGGDVLLHMLMPNSYQYYARAISESPATPLTATIAQALATGDKIANKVGCNRGSYTDVLNCLRKAPVRLLVNDASLTGGTVVDRVQLMDTPLRLFRDGQFNRKAPLLSGVCAEEGNILALLGEGAPPMSQERYEEVLVKNWDSVGGAKFVELEYKSIAETQGYWQATSQSEGDGWINCFCADAVNSTAKFGVPTYRYLWTHIPVNPGWIPKEMNATHSVELPFVFNLHEVFTPAEFTLCKQTMSYWVSFMTCGNPNGCSNFSGEPRPVWPLFNPEKQNTILVLDEKISLTTSFRDEQCVAWNAFVWYK